MLGVLNAKWLQSHIHLWVSKDVDLEELYQ
jgi:hypothetical protein